MKKICIYLKKYIHLQINKMAEIQKFIKEKNLPFEDIKEILINEPYNFSIKETDKLYMVSFTDLSDYTDNLTREANGVILDKENNNVVHFSFNKCYDGIKNKNTEIIDCKYLKDFYSNEVNEENIVIEEYNEGSLIKVYYFEDRWNISTSRTLEADKTYWTSKKSFEELFNESVDEEFYDYLDKDYCYTYLLIHPEIKMVVDNKDINVKFVNKVNLNTFEECIYKEKQDITLEEATNSTNKNYIVYYTEENGKTIRIKLLNKEYIALKLLRGEIHDIGLRYLEVYEDFGELMKSKFPQCKKKFEIIDTLLFKTSKYIQNLYFEKYVKKLEVEIPKKFEITIRQLHYNYRKTREYITIGKVKTHLINISNPKSIAYIIGYRY